MGVDQDRARAKGDRNQGGWPLRAKMFAVILEVKRRW